MQERRPQAKGPHVQGSEEGADMSLSTGEAGEEKCPEWRGEKGRCVRGSVCENELWEA